MQNLHITLLFPELWEVRRCSPVSINHEAWREGELFCGGPLDIGSPFLPSFSFPPGSSSLGFLIPSDFPLSSLVMLPWSLYRQVACYIFLHRSFYRLHSLLGEENCFMHSHLTSSLTFSYRSTYFCSPFCYINRDNTILIMFGKISHLS